MITINLNKKKSYQMIIYSFGIYFKQMKVVQFLPR